MEGIDILGLKDETQTFYLKSFRKLFSWLSRYFLFKFEKVFENITSQEKENIDYKQLSREITTPSKKTFSFLQKHGNLYDFLTNVPENKSLDNVRLLQVGFLDDLMSGFNVYKKIKGENSAIDLYLYLLRNPRRTVYDLFLNIPTDKYNKEIYLQTLFIYRHKNCLV